MFIILENKRGVALALALAFALAVVVGFLVMGRDVRPSVDVRLTRVGRLYQRASNSRERYFYLKSFAKELQSSLHADERVGRSDAIEALGVANNSSKSWARVFLQVDWLRDVSLEMFFDEDKLVVTNAEFRLDNYAYRQWYPSDDDRLPINYLDIDDAMSDGVDIRRLGFATLVQMTWIEETSVTNMTMGDICRLIEQRANVVLRKLNRECLKICVVGEQGLRYSFSLRAGCLMSVLQELMVNTGFVPSVNFEDILENPKIIMRHTEGIVDPVTGRRNKSFGYL